MAPVVEPPRDSGLQSTPESQEEPQGPPLSGIFQKHIYFSASSVSCYAGYRLVLLCTPDFFLYRSKHLLNAVKAQPSSFFRFDLSSDGHDCSEAS